MLLDWLDIQAREANHSEKSVTLSPLAWLILLDASMFYANTSNWRGAGNALTDTEIDEIEAATADIIHLLGS